MKGATSNLVMIYSHCPVHCIKGETLFFEGQGGNFSRPFRLQSLQAVKAA